MLARWLENEPKETLVCAVVSVISLVLSITGVLKGALPVDIAWVAIVLCGGPILVGAFKGVVFEHDIKADLLVAMALIASAATGEYFAAGEVALIMQIGSLLEDYTSGKAREGIERLIRMTPQTARVRRDGAYAEIPADEVAVGDVLMVIAGETVPVDGTILEGETSIDQSVMTGESIPVDKAAGDAVSSGTINQFGQRPAAHGPPGPGGGGEPGADRDPCGPLGHMAGGDRPLMRRADLDPHRSVHAGSDGPCGLLSLRVHPGHAHGRAGRYRQRREARDHHPLRGSLGEAVPHPGGRL